MGIAPRSRSRQFGLFTAASLAAAAGLAAPASALTINLTFTGGTFFDPITGANRTAELQPVLRAAADYWEDIIEDAHTLNLNFSWAAIGGSTLADHSLTAQGGTPNRQTAGNLRFDTSRRWFFDATPTNDSEFNMQQTLWRDLTATQQTNFYNGTAPDRFEVGYGGAALASAPDDARLGFDLLSVAMHEIGHALGMSAANTSTQSQTADGDYDFATNLMVGNTLAARIAAGNNIAHLACTFCLMDPSTGTGVRTQISPSDVFSGAAASQWTNIDLIRKEFIGLAGSGTIARWTSNNNWIGNDRPDGTEDAFIRSRNVVIGVVGTPESASARSVLVAEGVDLNINDGSSLAVTNRITIDGDNSDVFVATGGTLTADGLTVRNGSAQLNLTGGSANIGGAADIQAGAELAGRGTYTQSAGDLVNEGLIIASGGDLTLTSAQAGAWDLDGSSGEGSLSASTGNLTIIGTLNDSFDGTATINADRTLSVNSGWTLGFAGFPPTIPGNSANLVFNTGTTTATLAGGTATMTNVDVSVTGTGVALITAPTVWQSGTSVVLDAGETLELDGAATFNGGSYTGAGTLRFDGPVTIAASTTIAVATLDLDGFVPYSVLTVNPGATFTINSQQIEGSGANVFDAVINLDGTMAVNTTDPWTMAGTLNLRNNGGTAGTLNGQAVTVSGDLSSTNGGFTVVNAPVEFTSTAVVTVPAASDELRLQGPITYRGGSYTGAGDIRQFNDATVAANTTISVTGAYDWDGGGLSDDTTINPGVTFTLNVGSIDLNGDNGYGSTTTNNGTLVVNVAANAWTIDPTGTIVMGAGSTLAGDAVTVDGALTGVGTVTSANVTNIGDITVGAGTLTINPSGATTWTNDVGGVVTLGAGSTLAGDAITSNGSITGQGSITAADLTNNGSITASGGTLTLNTAAFPDLDGSGAETGVLNVLAGNMTVPGDFGGLFAFNGELNLASTRTFTMANSGLSLQGGANTGVINMTGGTYNAPLLSVSGELNSATNVGTLQTDVTFGAAGTTTIASSDLRIVGSAVVQPGHTMTGAGRLVNRSGSTLSGSGVVSVDVRNEGNFNPGPLTGPGLFTINDNFVQVGAASNLTIQVTNDTAVGADRVNISGSATLAGRLTMELNPAYVPEWNDRWTILSFASRSGDFTAFTFPALADANLRWFRAPGASIYEVGIRHVADVNRDGTVNFLDLNFVLAQTGQSAPVSPGLPGLTGDANEDGNVNFLDLNFILAFIGTSAPTLIPGPGGAALMAMALGLMGARRRRSA